MTYEALVNSYRNGIVENIHPGHICIVDETKRVKYKVGDCEHITFLRSTFKPIQAIAMIMNQVKEHFNLTNREMALFASSHRGEHFHIEQLKRLIKKIGIKEHELQCQPAYPLNTMAKDTLIRANKPMRRIYHNCSGKHLGMIALSKVLGVSHGNYFDTSHPVQKEIRKVLSLFSELSIDEIGSGFDGCGVPTFSLSLESIASMYLKLASPECIADEKIRQATQNVAEMMSENPDIISGTDAITTALLKDDNIIAKGGSQGIYCLGLKKEKLGIALKVLDGTEEQWPLIVAKILKELKYTNHATIERLYAISNKDIFSDNMKLVGKKEAVFELREC